MVPTRIRGRLYAGLWLALGILVVANMHPNAIAQEKAREIMGGPFEMWDGVIIDPERARAYLMKPGRGIEAVALADGRPAWTSNAASKPLVAIGDRLVAQGEAGKAPGVVLIDASNGAILSTMPAELPDDVVATAGKTLQGQFHANGFRDGDDAVVTWTYQQKIIRGIDTGQEGEGRPKAEGGRRGALRIKLAEGKMLSENFETKEARALKNSLAGYGNRLGDKPPSVEGVSADGRHTLLSRRMGNQAGAGNFRWSLAERLTRAPVGQLEMSFAYAPFFIRDGVIFVQAKAQTTNAKQGVQTSPLRLRAIDLKSRKEIWSQQVRDASDLGDLPP